MTATKDDRPVRTDEATSDQAAGEILTRVTPRTDIWLPIAAGRASRPIGRRQMPVVVVLSCPYCRHVHVHRATASDTTPDLIRAAGCGKGDYFVRATGALQ